MSEIYLAKDGEMVDEICWRYYAAAQMPVAVERVYAANRGLSALGPRLKAGTAIILPDLPLPEAVPLIRIWG